MIFNDPFELILISNMIFISNLGFNTEIEEDLTQALEWISDLNQTAF